VDEGRKNEDAAQLRKVVSALEEEVSFLRRRLREAPGRAADLEADLAKAQERLDRVVHQNDKLSALLEEAREQLGVLREEVEKLTQPPNNFGTVLNVSEDGTVDILTGNRKLRVSAQPSVEVKKLQIGQEVLLNEAFNIIDVRFYEPAGEVLRVREVMDDAQRDRLVSNVAGHLSAGVSEPVLLRAFAYWKNIDPQIGARIEQAVRAG